jgi:pantothenate kinase
MDVGAGTIPQTIPSCQELATRALTLQRTLGRCVFIAIAGGPGSGKSTVAKAVASAINHDASSSAGQEDVAVVLPMDGYHISKANLKIMARDKGTTYEALMARRGAPWTFDHEQLIQDLTKAAILFKEERDDDDGGARLKQEFEFPTYSRDISDPVPGGVCLKAHHKIFICEGNYLLALEDEHWKPLESLWDEGWLVVAPSSVQLERLIHRHLLTWTDEKTKLWGPGQEGGALARAQANDLKNAEWISQTSTQHANVIIQNP